MPLIFSWIDRSQKHLLKKLLTYFTLKPLPLLNSIPKEQILYKFEHIKSLNDFIIGSDSDIGGESIAHWAYKNDAETKIKSALFYGSLSMAIPENSKDKLDRSGYVALRSKRLPMTLFHHPTHDLTFYRYLEITARGNKKLWMINIQTDSLYPSVLWQHRLFFTNPGQWETIRIPFRDFVKTANGIVQKSQLKMDKSQIKTIGFSLLRQPGEFELEIQEIKAVNSDFAIGDYDIELPSKETILNEAENSYHTNFNHLSNTQSMQSSELPQSTQSPQAKQAAPILTENLNETPQKSQTTNQ